MTPHQFPNRRMDWNEPVQRDSSTLADRGETSANHSRLGAAAIAALYLALTLAAITAHFYDLRSPALIEWLAGVMPGVFG